MAAQNQYYLRSSICSKSYISIITLFWILTWNRVGEYAAQHVILTFIRRVVPTLQTLKRRWNNVVEDSAPGSQWRVLRGVAILPSIIHLCHLIISDKSKISQSRGAERDSYNIIIVRLNLIYIYNSVRILILIQIFR